MTSASGSPRPPLPPYPEVTLNAWRFDEESLLTDAATAPLAALNPHFVESWSGHALCMDGPDPTLFALAEFSADGRLNLSMNGSGTIRFWFAPEWTSAEAGGVGPGAAVRLLEIGAWSGKEAVGWWSLGIDPEGTAIGLVAQDGGRAATVLEAPIQWVAGQWHQVALMWAPDGPSVLCLDGQVAALGPAVATKAWMSLTGTRGFCVGSDVWGGALAQGQFEEVHTFGRVLTEAEVALDYERNASRSTLGPVTFEEENTFLAAAAMSLALAGPAGSGGSQFAMGSGNYDCDLWLEIGPPESGAVAVNLHNTAQGYTYKLWSKTNLDLPTWTLQQTLTGLEAQTPAVPITVGGKAAMFFKAEQVGIAIGTSFEGIGQVEAESSVPDSMGAIGLNHFVEIVNYRIAVFDKSTGARVAGEAKTLLEFFGGVGGQHIFDPRILYDHQSHAWVACALESNSKSVRLAVKADTNPVPLSGWSKYSITISYQDSLPDFTTLGVDKNGVYVTALQRRLFEGQEFNDAQTILAIKKPAIYGGTLSHTQFTIDTDPSGLKVRTIQPAVNFDDPPVGGYAYLVAKGPSVHGPPYRGGALYYRKLRWNAGGTAELVDSAWQLVAEPTPTYRDYFDLDDGTVRAPQLGDPPGGPSVIDLNFTGSRLMTAVIRDNVLWTCQHIGLNGPGGTYDSNDTSGEEVDRTGAQWIKLALAPEGTGLAYAAHGRVYDDCLEKANPYWYYFPSLMVNAANDMAMGFSGGSAETYIGAFYSWRKLNGQSADTPILLKAGQAYFPITLRFGDYSGTTLDPVGGLSFWTVQEFAKDPEVVPTDPWGTWITKLTPEP